MTIAREEIFGPVISILPYKDEDEAISIANDTEYGLSGYVSGSQERAQKVAEKIRSGNVHVNGAGPDFSAHLEVIKNLEMEESGESLALRNF